MSEPVTMFIRKDSYIVVATVRGCSSYHNRVLERIRCGSVSDNFYRNTLLHEVPATMLENLHIFLLFSLSLCFLLNTSSVWYQFTSEYGLGRFVLFSLDFPLSKRMTMVRSRGPSKIDRASVARISQRLPTMAQQISRLSRTTLMTRCEPSLIITHTFACH